MLGVVMIEEHKFLTLARRFTCPLPHVIRSREGRLDNNYVTINNKMVPYFKDLFIPDQLTTTYLEGMFQSKDALYVIELMLIR